MRLNPECIPCLLGNQLERYPKDIDNSKKIAYMQAILRVIADASDSMSAPMIMREITKIQRQMFGNEMDYSEIKRHFNQLMLEKEMDVQTEIDASEDELKLAIQFAIIGNFIDFGAMKSVNEQKLEEYVRDPLCSFMFTVNAYYNMMTGMQKIRKKEAVFMIPKNLPILMEAGSDDPVGDFGKGVRKIFGIYKRAGIKDVTLQLYPGARHELLNETVKDRVYEDIYDWLKERMR